MSSGWSASTRRCASTVWPRSECHKSSIFIGIVPQIVAVQLEFCLSNPVQAIPHISLGSIQVLDAWKMKAERGQDQSAPIVRFGRLLGFALDAAKKIDDKKRRIHRRSIG